jgi:hypothetical protein
VFLQALDVCFDRLANVYQGLASCIAL